MKLSSLPHRALNGKKKKKKNILEGFLFLCLHFAAALIQSASAIMTFVV